MITVTAVDDDIDRDDSGTLSIEIDTANSDTSYSTVPSETVQVTITDDETSEYILSSTASTIAEAS